MTSAGLGLDRLLDFFFQCLYLLKFWYVVNEYSQIVILTLGRPRNWRGPVRGPGLHLIMPLGIEEVIQDNVVPCDLANVTINMTLKEGTPLFVEISGRWRITDMIKFQLENENTDAILENVAGMVQEFLFQFTWQELMEHGMRGRGGLTQRLRTYCNSELREWGAELDRLYIRSFIRTNLRDGVIKIL